jgi:hypothetical protein
MRQNRDWYVVLYQLAAQRTNHALREGGPHRSELEQAFDECCRLVTAAATTLQRRRAYRRRLDDTDLIRFLDQTLLPTTCVLWAGVMELLSSAHPTAERATREPVTLDQLAAGKTPSSYDLVAFATKKQPDQIPYRVRYNLACYYASLAASSDSDRTARLDQAEEHLREAIGSVFGTTKAYLAAKAKGDPSLTTLRNDRHLGFLEEAASTAPEPSSS